MNNIQGFDLGNLNDMERNYSNQRRIQRARFWLSAFLKVLILFGVIVTLLCIYSIMGDYQCRNEEYVYIPLPCTPVDEHSYVDAVKNPSPVNQWLWCSAPVVLVEPTDHNCYPVQAFNESSPLVDVKCYRAKVTHRAWYSTIEPTTLGVGYRTYYHALNLTRVFTFTCSNNGPKIPFNHPVRIERNVYEKDYLPASDY